MPSSPGICWCGSEALSWSHDKEETSQPRTRAWPSLCEAASSCLHRAALPPRRPAGLTGKAAGWFSRTQAMLAHRLPLYQPPPPRATQFPAPPGELRCSRQPPSMVLISHLPHLHRPSPRSRRRLWQRRRTPRRRAPRKAPLSGCQFAHRETRLGFPRRRS